MIMRLLRRLRALLIDRRDDAELRDEIFLHRELKAQELRDQGVGEAEIAAATQRALGNDLSARQQARDVWVWPWLQDISQDIRFGIRMLAKDRRFTLAAVVALGLGIAVNNSVFTILNTALLRDPPFDQPSRLIDVRIIDRRGENGSTSFPDFQQWREAATSFEGLAAYGGGTLNVSEAGRPAERLRGAYVSANTFRLLRIEPILGRTFVADDDKPGAHPVAIIGDSVWRGRYGGETAVIGRVVRINDLPSTIVGVMPPGFAFPMTVQIWAPLSQQPGVATATRSMRNLSVFGRLAGGADLVRARAELDGLVTRQARDFPETNKDFTARVLRMKDARMAGTAPFFTMLFGAVVFVLFIACANVASLLLARSAQRSREIAVRSSLGATRWRIIRQLLVECGVIGVLAGALGLVLSIYGANAMSVAFNVTEISAPDQAVKPDWVNLGMDGIAWVFLGGLSLLASLGTGLVPSWHLSKTNVNDVLKEGGRSGAGTLRARRWTGGLLIAQLALTLILLTGAGLLVRSFFDLYFKDLVIDTTNIVTMRMELPVRKYVTPEQRKQFVSGLDARLAPNPLFSSVTLASDIPLQPLGFPSRLLQIDGRTIPAGDTAPSVSFVNVGPRYFETLGLPVVRGRAFTGLDGRAGREGAIVNQRFAALYSPDSDPIGRRLQLTGATLPATAAPWLTIVGVVPTLPNFFPGRLQDPVVYVPIEAERAPQRVVSVIVRAASGGGSAIKAAATAALRDEVAAIDPDLPLFAIQTLEEAVARSRYPNRVLGSWFITLAMIALILATVGLYALTAHGVAQRAGEIGVRMALGAQAGQVVWLFVRRTLLQLVIGLSLGIAGALAVGKLLSTFLRDTNPRDPITLALVSVLLVVVAMVASIWPARKAARVDPVVALRAD